MEHYDMWERITIRLDQDVAKRVKIVAAVMGISQGDLIEQLLTTDDSLDSLEREYKIHWQK